MNLQGWQQRTVGEFIEGCREAGGLQLGCLDPDLGGMRKVSESRSSLSLVLKMGPHR